MKILHSYCLNYNIGDYALGIGVKNVLRKYLDVDFIGDTNIQGRQFDEYYIEQVVNKKYDLLVLGGGGIIHGAHWPNGWFWLINQDLIRKIKIPFMVYGVGNNYFENEVVPERAVSHLRETFSNALSFSVRNDGSFERIINQVGINPVEVPDPGFHVSLNTKYDRPFPEKYVIIQVANDKIESRFRTDINYSFFIKSMRDIIITLNKKYHVILAPHVFDDIELSMMIKDGIPNCSIWNFSHFAFDHTSEAISYYKYADFVLAMRGHGQILPIGFNVPVIALSNHPKHRGLMEKLDLSDYTIDIDGSDFAEEAIRKISKIETEYESIKHKLLLLNEQMNISTANLFSSISEKLKK